MIKLSEGGSIADMWPDNKEPEYQAIAYALKLAIRRILLMIKESMVYAGIDDLQEDAVDILAAELAARGYDQDAPIKVKREEVKAASLYYSKAGTARAIRLLIQALYGDAHLEEWFNYAGDPFHFRIGIDITDQQQTVPMLTNEELADLIRGVVRESAHLDDVSFVIRPGLFIGQSSSLYIINPQECGEPYCGTIPLHKKAGYSGSGNFVVLEGDSAYTSEPYQAGTWPSEKVAAESIAGALISGLAPEEFGAEPREAADVYTGTSPKTATAGGTISAANAVGLSTFTRGTAESPQAGTDATGTYPVIAKSGALLCGSVAAKGTVTLTLKDISAAGTEYSGEGGKNG